MITSINEMRLNVGDKTIFVPIKGLHILSDIDKTISDDRHREHFLENLSNNKNRNRAWENYYSRMGEDPFFPKLTQLLNRLASMENRITFTTGRPERFRAETEKWLIRNFPVIPRHEFNVLMRAEGDFRPNVEVKLYLLLSIIRDPLQRNPDVVFEDDEVVLEMYRSHKMSVVDAKTLY